MNGFKKIVMRKLFCLFIVVTVWGSLMITAQTTPRYRVIQAEVVDSTKFAPFEEIKKIKNCRQSLKECAFEAMAVHGLEGFGGPETIHFFEHQFRYKKNGKDIGVFVFSILNREEKESVDERTRVEFVREKGAWKFVTIGNQSRCVNNTKMTKWSKVSC